MLDHREIIRILTTVNDSLSAIASSLKLDAKRKEPQSMDAAVSVFNELTLECENNFIALGGEIGAIEALCVDLQHQKDCLDTKRADIRLLSASRRAH